MHNINSFKRFDAPPKIPIRISDHPEDNERILADIVNTGYDYSRKKVDKALASVGTDVAEKLEDAAEEHGFDSISDYLGKRIAEVSQLYVGYRTGLLWVKDNFNGKDVTISNISIKLTELSENLGTKLTTEIYRTLTSNLDMVLDARYGKSL